MELPRQVSLALTLLAAAGHEAYVVGGAVRDYVRGCPGKDWDIATGALPEEVKDVFSGCPTVETGVKHGTVTVVADGLPLEITTYRVEGGYSDHRRPDAVRFTASLREDLARRDFTMNALAYHPSVGVVDLVGGTEDIRRGLIRCVGDPERRFREDALRMLRALRFASALEMAVEPATARAIHENRGLLVTVAAERVQAELTGLLCGPGAEGVLREYGDVLAAVLPELLPMQGFWQHNPHHDRDVWAHTAAVVSHIPPQPVLRWTALLHDVGKPRCFALDEQGVGHFYGHAGQSAALAEELLRRLRFDNATRERVVLLVKNHDTPLPEEERGIRRLMNRLGAEAALQLVQVHRADTAGLHPDFACRYAELDRVQTLMEELLRQAACFSLKDLAINGRDLLALGLEGRAVGQGLQQALSAVMDGAVPNRREELLEYLKGRES